MRLLLFIPSGILIYFLCCYLNGVPEARGLGRKITKFLPFGDDSIGCHMIKLTKHPPLRR